MADDTGVVAGDEPLGVTYLAPTPKPQSMEQTVLEDEATHPAYMNIMFWAMIAVAVIGGLALVALFVLSWFARPVPDGLASVPQLAVVILGVLLVGDVLLGKLAVKA